MKRVPSFNVQIWCGLRIGYTDTIHALDDVRVICDEFIDDFKDCVTITPTEYRYVDGYEPGVIVGYIQYPRFIREPEEIIGRALNLAQRLMIRLGQNRVTVTTPDESIMLELE